MTRRRHYTLRYAPLAKWTLPRVLARMDSRIEDAKAALHDIVAMWGDIDQGIVEDADQKIRELDEWLAQMKQGVQERVEAGEHVGP
ncbi:hypothetical protein [Xanthobacter autotrophicus]|uniref:hypothetical protein n=1 Tax=Xanthobacter autotrophicus TaxID=280 RepID=UPI00372AFA22